MKSILITCSNYCKSMEFATCYMFYSCGPQLHHIFVERGSSVVERQTRNQVSPGSNPPLLSFRRLGIFVLSTDAPVDSAV